MARDQQDSPAKTYRLLVVDDQPEFLEFAAILLGGDRRLRIVGKAAHGRDALALAAKTGPDAALVDINMPGLDGFEVTRRLRAAQPDLRVVMMTAVMEREYQFLAAQAGSLACISKAEVAPARLLDLLESGAPAERPGRSRGVLHSGLTTPARLSGLTGWHSGGTRSAPYAAPEHRNAAPQDGPAGG